MNSKSKRTAYQFRGRCLGCGSKVTGERRIKACLCGGKVRGQ